MLFHYITIISNKNLFTKCSSDKKKRKYLFPLSILEKKSPILINTQQNLLSN